MPGHSLNLSEADIEAAHLNPKVVAASRKLQNALEAITGWRLASKNGIPNEQLRVHCCA
jgi:hypothetical protein